MALRGYKPKVLYGHPEVIELTGSDWLKILSRTYLFSEATGDRPEGFVPQEAQISFDGEPEVSLRSGLELRPEGGFNQVTIFNPNEGLPLEIELLIGTGDIRDSSVTFNIDPSAALAVNVQTFATDVSLPTTISGSVRLDNEYHLFNPLGVVFRGGPGTAPTTPLYITSIDEAGEGTMLGVSGEVSITNTADNPVQTTLANIRQSRAVGGSPVTGSGDNALCVDICNDSGSPVYIRNTPSNALQIDDSGITQGLTDTRTLITATNGKLDITNNGLGSIASGIATNGQKLDGIATDISADRTNNANTANALTTTNAHLTGIGTATARLEAIQTNTARGDTPANPLHTTATLTADETINVLPMSRIMSYPGAVKIGGRLSELAGDSFEAQQAFAPQQITFAPTETDLFFAGGDTDLSIDMTMPTFSFDFRGQVRIFRGNPQRAKLEIKALDGAVLLSNQPFALPRTHFSGATDYSRAVREYFSVWQRLIDTANTDIFARIPKPLSMIRNIQNNVISGSGFADVIQIASNRQSELVSTGGILDGQTIPAPDDQVIASGMTSFILPANQWSQSQKQNNGLFVNLPSYKLLKMGETYETEGIGAVYALSVDNETGFHITEADQTIGVMMEFEESNYVAG